MAASTTVSLLLFATVAAMVFNSVAATEYTVGAPSGAWNLQTNLTSWVASKSFKTGDSLLFTYSPSFHNVLEVTKTSYDSCSASNPIKTYNDGNTKIALTTSGTRYFICGITGHCDGGMKVTIAVATTSSSAPSPSTSTPTASSPSGSTTPTAASPGGSNGAAGLTATAALTAWLASMVVAM